MMEDFVSWNYTRNGIFSVRSAYHSEWNYQHDGSLLVPMLRVQRRNRVWPGVWKIKAAAKIKIFSWRFLHGTIPCNCVPANRHVITSSLCPLCKVGCEDTTHVFFKCPRVLEIWENLGLADIIHRATVVDRDGSAVFEGLLSAPESKVNRFPDVGLQELIATACWYIWWERRQAVRGENIAKPASSAHAIAALATNYFKAFSKRAGIRRHGWEKPEDYVKLNVDASFIEDTGTGATGAVIRDHRGIFLAGCCFGLENVVDAPSAEAHVLRDGLILASQLGCSRIVVNSDCMEVVETMQNAGNSMGPAAVIYEECSFLARGFTHVIFEHCPRESNVVAHYLAANATSNYLTTWFEDPPNFICNLLISDVTHISNK